jgi:predicted negative regulator of RcsB-dependent stress response
MSVLANDQEQIEAIKTWWKNYGKVSLLVFLLGIALSYGWRMWQSSEQNFSQQASLIYDQMLSSFNQQNQDALIAQANSLSKDFTKTPYANMANFMLASQAVQKGDLDKAYLELKKIMDSAKDSKIRQIARVRAARILLSKHELKQALALLDTVDNEIFLSEINEVRGDIFLAMGNSEKARSSYKEALTKLPKEESSRPILEMKFEQLSAQTNALA